MENRKVPCLCRSPALNRTICTVYISRVDDTSRVNITVFTVNTTSSLLRAENVFM